MVTEQEKQVVIAEDTEFAQGRVPDSARQGFMQIVFIMVGFTFFSPSMIAGGKLGLGLTLRDFIIAVVLGNVFLSIYTGFLANISQRTGMNLDLLAAHTFGSKGSYLSSALISLTQLGWFGVGVAMFAIPVSKLFGINTYLLVIIIGIAMTLTAVLGVKALAAFGTLAVPLIAILGFYSVFQSIQHVGGVQNVFAEVPPAPLAMPAAISMVISNFISGGTATPNFTRFAKTKKQAVSATVIAFFVGNVLMFIFGAVGAAVYQKPDIFDVLIIQGLTIPAILTLGLNIWSTNNNALYTSGLGFANITKKKMKPLTAIAGILGTVAAVYLYDNFVGYLSFLGSMIPPVGAVIICHYFRHKKAYDVEDVNQVATSFNLASVLAVVLGIVGAILLPGDFKPVYGLVISCVTYFILDALIPVRAEKTLLAE